MAQTQGALDILQSAKGFNNEANRILHNAALHILNQEHGLASSPMHSVLHCESRWMPQAQENPRDCEMCGRFAGEMEDPTFDPARTYRTTPLWICELCAKNNIESEMLRLGMQVIQ